MDDSNSGNISHANAYWQSHDAHDNARDNALDDTCSITPDDKITNSQTNTHDNHDKQDKHDKRIPLGMEAFDQKARDQFGQQVRLAMALMEGSITPVVSASRQTVMPTQPEAIAARLKTLGREIASTMADQLELLVRFDEQQAWQLSGARHCVAWMDLELGISRKLGWEYLRAGRRLRSLPITRTLFRSGSLSWSKVRLISRFANPEIEALLCHSALDSSVAELERLCREYRWQEEQSDADSKTENALALQQFETRAFTWNTASNGNTTIRLSLPPELARAFLNGVEQSLTQLEEHVAPELPKCKHDTSENQATMRQRRADAAVLMAESSLQSAGRDIATADRYQVIVTVDATELSNESDSESAKRSEQKTNRQTHPQTKHCPNQHFNESINNSVSKRPSVVGAGPIAQETARRLACDCSVSAIALNAHGEPTDIGRKSRLWPPAMARAIKTRDQRCQFPGCTITRHLQIHHIQHWADGGSTSVDNGVCLCSRHHTFVHEGGYRLQRVAGHTQRLNEQFTRQQANVSSHTTDQARNHESNAAFTDVERLLRNSRESFDAVRSVSPTQFRFRVVDTDNQQVRDSHVLNESEQQYHNESIQPANYMDSAPADATHSHPAHNESTRIDSKHNDTIPADPKH